MSTSPSSNQTTHNNETVSIANNLRTLMFQNNIDSIELSKKTGIALTTINLLKKGGGNPTLSTLLTVANYFGITLNELTTGTIHKKIFEIPLIDISESELFNTKQKNHRDTISCEMENSEIAAGCFAVKMNNNSLSPFFEKGTIFIIDSKKLPQDGDIVLVKFGESLPCFRKIFIEADSHYFKSVSEIMTSSVVKTQDYSLCGVVIKAIQQFI